MSECISKGFHDFFALRAIKFPTENLNGSSQTSAEAHSRAQRPWKFFLMSNNHENLIKKISTGFGLCPKRKKDGCLLLFQQWDAKENSGSCCTFPPHHNVIMTLGKKQTRSTTAWMHWNLKNSIGFTFSLIMQHVSQGKEECCSQPWKYFWSLRSILARSPPRNLKVSWAKLNHSICWWIPSTRIRMEKSVHVRRAKINN